MSLFTHIRPRDFNRDGVVLCHELGHAVVWLHQGRTIDQLRLFRSPHDGLLEGGVAFHNPQSLRHRTDAEPLAERFLAGDSAARKALNLRRDQISTASTPVARDSDIPALLRVANTDDDAIRAVWVAYETMKPSWCEPLFVRLGMEPKWYSWLRDRLAQAVSIIDSKWVTIQHAANALTSQLPAAGDTLLVPSSDLLALLTPHRP